VEARRRFCEGKGSQQAQWGAKHPAGNQFGQILFKLLGKKPGGGDERSTGRVISQNREKRGRQTVKTRGLIKHGHFKSSKSKWGSTRDERLAGLTPNRQKGEGLEQGLLPLKASASSLQAH